jgi:hypothetical protein
MDINPNNPVATASYISGRKRWARPQAMLWSDNAGTIEGNLRYPSGREKEDFIICSDHNRSEMSISNQRIETRQRMINATMRSYHVADKISISVGWDRLPSRSYNRSTNFDALGDPISLYPDDKEFTVDGGAGGVELLDWYENHSGPFYVYLGYDKFNASTFNTGGAVTDASFNHLSVYNDVRLMYFASFDYSVQLRGATNHDMWSVNVTLEEA